MNKAMLFKVNGILLGSFKSSMVMKIIKTNAPYTTIKSTFNVGVLSSKMSVTELL